MEAKLLRDILEESTSAYIKFKSIKQNEIYTSIEVIDKNKAYAELDDINKKAFGKELIISIFENNNLNAILQSIAVGSKSKINVNIQSLNSNYTLYFFKGKDNEFHCKFNKLHLQTYYLSETLKKSPFLAWIKDLEGRYLDVNLTYMKLIGKSYDEIIGKTDYDLWPNEVADNFNKYDEIVKQNNKLEIYNEYFYTNIHEKTYFQTSKWPYTNKNNGMVGIIGIAVDITDKKKLKEALRKNEEIFSEIANNIDDIIFTRDENKMLYLSPSFKKKYDYCPELLLKDINSWMNMWDKVEFIDPPGDYFDKNITTTTYKVTKGNEERWSCNKSIPVFDENGNITKRIGIVSDITENKKLEDELEKLRFDFFANLSHELRTPINLVISSLEVIKLRLNNLNNEDHEYFNKYLKIINQNGLRLLKLVNNLIDTTKIDSGQFSFEPQNYDIVNFVEDICMSVSPFVKQNDMEIIFDTNVEENLLSFDLDNMERIILNLLSNAIKFNSPQGKIEVVVYCDEKVSISVKDDGVGIPEDNLENIFGRFEQVKYGNPHNTFGSGIGLSLVKSLVEFHEGSISVNSKLGEGSEFIVTLPNIVREDLKSEEIINTHHNVNMMKVEFSDIYT